MLFHVHAQRKYASHFNADLKYWRCWGIINPKAPVLTGEVYFSVAEIVCKGSLTRSYTLVSTLKNSKVEEPEKSRNWRRKWPFIPSPFFFFCFPLIEPTQSFCPSFAKGPINCNSPFTCLLTVFSLRQTKKEDKLSGAESGEKKSPCSLHLPALDTAVSRKTKGESLQGYRQTGAAWDEITQRRAEDETLLVTPLSLLDSVKR